MKKIKYGKKVKILGTEYTIFFRAENEDKRLEELEGYTDLFEKEIVIINLKSRDNFKNDKEDKIIKVQNKILRHEIIHAFLFESGLDCNSKSSIDWAENEEMVDWFAIQSPKILEVFKELEII